MQFKNTPQTRAVLLAIAVACLYMASALALVFGVVPARAETIFKQLPEKAQILMTYGPGGAADLQARHLQGYLAEKGVSLTPVYKAGALGLVAFQEMPKLAKDGSVIVFTAAGFIANAEMKLHTVAAEPLSIAGVTLQALIVNPTGEYSTLEKFEAALKAKDSKLDMGNHSVGSLFMLRRYTERIGADVPLIVNYKTPVESSLAVAGGHIKGAIVPMSTAEPLMLEKKVNVIVGFGSPNIPLPDGIVNASKRWKGWKHTDGFMIAAVPGTDPQMKAVWLAALKEYYNDPKTREFYFKHYLSLDSFGPDDARALVSAARKDLETIPTN